MKHRVSTLDGMLLDSAVAKAEGEAPYKQLVRITFGDDQPAEFRLVYKPYSSQWNHGGPIIARAGICLQSPEVMCRELGSDSWWAGVPGSLQRQGMLPGLTPLIAAMRAYVASTFGDSVDLP